jgi:hypothetical protein
MDEEGEMDLTRFSALCEAFGGDLARWPGAEREAGLQLAQSDPAASAALADARGLDDVLALSAPQIPSPALRERVLAAAPRERSRPRPRFDWLFKAGLGAGLAAAGVAGVLVGSALSAGHAPEDSPALAALESSPEATAFGPADETLEG